jgi:hypothetical protein
MTRCVDFFRTPVDWLPSSAFVKRDDPTGSRPHEACGAEKLGCFGTGRLLNLGKRDLDEAHILNQNLAALRVARGHSGRDVFCRRAVV